MAELEYEPEFEPEPEDEQESESEDEQESDNEIWKDIDGHSGYQISSLGRVKSLNFWNQIGKAHLLKLRSDIVGMLKVNLSGKWQRVQNLVAQAFLTNPDKLPKVYHLNGIRSDNRVQNLAWGTNADMKRVAKEARIRLNNGYGPHRPVVVHTRSPYKAKDNIHLSTEVNIMAAAIKYKLQPQSIMLVLMGVFPHAHKFRFSWE